MVYKLDREKLVADGHGLVEHDPLMAALRTQAREQDKGARQKAIAALRYAKKRQEGLVEWSFDISAIERKDIINWAADRIQPYFAKA